MPYRDFTSNRTTEPDLASLIAAVRTIEATAGPAIIDAQHYRIKTNTELSVGQISRMQTAIDTAPATSPRRTAQNEIRNWPISTRALLFTLLDQINFIRSRLSPPQPAITPAQALQAVLDKADTL